MSSLFTSKLSRDALLAKFNAKRDVQAGGCWLWTGMIDHGGYGMLSPAHNEHHKSHRLAYELFIGPIPNGLTIDHLCRVRACCNPRHLEAVTNATNLRRAAAARLHCKAGHVLVVKSEKQRYCRICHRERERRAYQSGQRYQRKTVKAQEE